MKNESQKFDVAVVGGGPAGMMAAGRAAEMGARVLLLEKNSSLGKKLLITGKGRCNITQAEFDNKKFIDELGKNGKFLFSSLSVFGPKEVIEFFESRKVPTKIERGSRVFPTSDKSQDVLRAIQNYLEENKVEILYNANVCDFKLSEFGNEKKISSVNLKDGKCVTAKKYILATGGKSYGATGSTGDGYTWAKNLGHTIIEPTPALVPVKIKEVWIKDLQGLSLKNVTINLLQNNKKKDSRFGEMLFTHFGLSGPIVLDASKKIGELAKTGEVIVSIDLKPALNHEQLDARLLRDFKENINKDFVNYLPELLPQKMIPVIISLSEMDPRKKINLITRNERRKIINLLKDLRLTTDGTTGFDQAIVTAGGVSLREVNSKTMQSKIIKNLFFAGEILDLDGPTGGYNLQICWSTGRAAGTNAAK